MSDMRQGHGVFFFLFSCFYFCENLMMNKQTELLNPVLPLLFEGAMSIAQAYGTEVLALCLESMEITLRVSLD